MRCFIAIDLPIGIKDYLFSLQNEIRNDYSKINFVSKKNLHLTLKFLGDINEGELENIKERLISIKFKKFEVSLDKVGVFPTENYIRVIWIGLKPAGKVIELQKKIDSELLDIFNRDERFNAHLTLGRVKFVKDKSKFLERLKNLDVENKKFFVDKFYFMKSDLRKEGPTYNTLEVFKLI